MPVVLLRIDDRLIHGQVTTAWMGNTKANHIIIASDEVANDEIRKNIVTITAPRSVKTEILGVQAAAERIKGPLASSKYRVMVICTGPHEALDLIREGVETDRIVVGNMGSLGDKKGAEPRQSISKSVMVNSQDITNFEALKELGFPCQIQVVPTDKPVDVLKQIQGKLKRR